MPYKNIIALKFSFLLRWTSMLLLIVTLPSQLEAKNKGHKKSVNRTNIVSRIDVNAHTLTVKDKIYILGEGAKITVNSKKSDFQHIKVGMQVFMTARVLTYGKRGGRTIYEARRIIARDAKRKK